MSEITKEGLIALVDHYRDRAHKAEKLLMQSGTMSRHTWLVKKNHLIDEMLELPYPEDIVYGANDNK